MGRLTSQATTAGTLLSALVSVSLVSVTLAGCSGDGDATTPKPSPTTSAAAPTTPPAPTPPPMPAAARAHTEAGAKAFVRYFWEVVDYASTNLDPDAIADLTDEGCVGCRSAVGLVRGIRDEQGIFMGATTTISKAEATWLTLADQQRMQVTFDVTTPEQRIDYPGSDHDESYPAGTRRTRFLLKPAPKTWRVVLWEPA